MIRKFTHKTPNFGGIASFIAVLTVLVALAAVAQTRGVSPAFGKSHVAAVQGSALPSAVVPMSPFAPLFLPTVTYGSGGGAAVSVAVGDLNGDGKPDLVVANYCSVDGCNYFDATVGVLLGNGDGTFRPAATYDLGTYPATSVAVADVNGDGKADIVVTVFQYVSVLLGNGDGTFQLPVAHDAGDCLNVVPCANGVAVADVNGDGKLDIVVSNTPSGTVAVLLGKGDGTFNAAKTYGSGGSLPGPVAVADLNGDGKLDIVVANVGDLGGGIPGTVGVLLGNGNGTFSGAVIYVSGGTVPLSVAVADVNGDGKPDLVVSNCGQSSSCSYGDEGVVGVLLGNGDGTFQQTVTYDAGGPDTMSVAVADINSDGKPDLLAGNRCAGSCSKTLIGGVNVLLGNGDGTFQAAETYSSGNAEPSSIAVADLNGDGEPDLAVANQNYSMGGTVAVLLHAGTRPTATTLTSSLNPAPSGQTVTYTADVSSQSGVTGTVTFWDGDATVATVALTGNQAPYGISYKPLGLHSITATYSGDLRNAGSKSNTLKEYVGFAPTHTTVTTSGSPSHLGQPVTFTATVTWTYGTVHDGEVVTFFDGTIAIGTGDTSGGVATFTISSLTVGTHSIKATYAGDAEFRPSTGSVTQVVKYRTTTKLTSSLNPSQFGQAVTFTAHVTSTGPAPTGNVKFLDGTTGIGFSTINGGVAKLTKSNLAVGSHPITAHYNGDALSATSASPVLNQVVQ